MKSILKLMDIKTLVAGVIPVIAGSVYSLYKYDSISILTMLVLMFGVILIQSCANMINDLFDYKRGADTDAKSDEKALASGEISPQNVRNIVIVFIAIDLLIALYYSVKINFLIFIIALSAALIMYYYSAGKRPISYTPFGELVAGATMGFGIMSTVIYIQSGVSNINIIIVAIPTSIYIGTILLTNNLSDYIEDKANGRHTLPIMIGINNAQFLWIFNWFLILVLTGVLYALNLLPFESLILCLIVMPYRSILNFKKIEKVVSNKAKMMGLVGSIGLRFHAALVIGLLIAVYVRPLVFE